MTAATALNELDWPWPEQIAAGHFQERLHRVRPGALAIELDGATYYAADCGAIAIPTTELPEDGEFCLSCWSCGVPVIAEPPQVPAPTAPVTLPDCLNWKVPAGARSSRRAESVVAARPTTRILATGAPAVGWFEVVK